MALMKINKESYILYDDFRRRRMTKNLSMGVIFGIMLLMTLGTIAVSQQQQSAYSFIDPEPDFRKAPMATFGDNVYIVWFNDNTPANDGEVFFRASDDNGATFGDKINLSNTTGIDSLNAEVNAVGDNVFVTWWERANATSSIPVLRISTDNGQTFGPVLTLGTNGTIGVATEAEGEEEGEGG